jgi:hypothetical protein
MRTILGTLLVTLAVAIGATSAAASTQDAPQFGYDVSVQSAGTPVSGHGTMDTYSFP